MTNFRTKKDISKHVMKKARISEYDISDVEQVCYIDMNGHFSRTAIAKTAVYDNIFELIDFIRTLPPRPLIYGIFKIRRKFYIRYFYCSKHECAISRCFKKPE